MRVAMVGTRGVPARYGGFETAIEEIGQRLAARGHEVVVYCRGGEDAGSTYLGMQLVHLPAVKRRAAETLSHTTLSVLHLARHRTDAAIVFNAANAPLLPVVRAARIPVATHVDGLEWQRGKWGPKAQLYYRRAEELAVRWSDDLIADARGIQSYYRDRHHAASTFLPYGAPIHRGLGDDRLPQLGLSRDRYHLVVARFEPENHVDLVLEGYSRSRSVLPLVVVGSAPYASTHIERINELAARDPRVHLVGAVWDQALLDQLYAHALTYLHGHSVGGTNPSLLRAMGAGANVVAYDVVFNREVLGATGTFVATSEQVCLALQQAEADPAAARARGERAQERAESEYDWDVVTDGYEALLERLVSTRRRRRA